MDPTRHPASPLNDAALEKAKVDLTARGLFRRRRRRGNEWVRPWDARSLP